MKYYFDLHFIPVIGWILFLLADQENESPIVLTTSSKQSRKSPEKMQNRSLPSTSSMDKPTSAIPSSLLSPIETQFIAGVKYDFDFHFFLFIRFVPFSSGTPFDSMATSLTASPTDIPVNINLLIKRVPKTGAVALTANGLPNGVEVSLKDSIAKPSSSNVKRAITFQSEYEDDFDSMMDECKLVHKLST